MLGMIQEYRPDHLLIVSISLNCVQVQVPEKYKKLIQRFRHGAAAVTFNSHYVEVIIFGGWNKGLSTIADPVVITFGKCIRE